ncbi:MAG TPA: hypothetical protein VMS37_19845 [Verrucomicrobiae bacterium]|nr:hypothetical protein [Verrucomicrobiae bacterium]
MRRPPATNTVSPRVVTVLSLSPNRDDHTSLRTIFDRSEWSLFGESKWALRVCTGVESALTALREDTIPIVIAERDLAPVSWKEMLARISLLPDPPLLIVTSLLADEYLWAEALNLGVYDVLAKPFDASEVIRVLSLAWQHWLNRHDLHRVRTGQRKAATAA